MNTFKKKWRLVGQIFIFIYALYQACLDARRLFWRGCVCVRIETRHWQQCDRGRLPPTQSSSWSRDVSGFVVLGLERVVMHIGSALASVMYSLINRLLRFRTKITWII